jgi:predicted nucleic acid-binding protein
MRLTLDSNVLIYAINRTDRLHDAAVDLIDRASRADCVQTLQSLGECFNVVTRRYRMSPADAAAELDWFRVLFPVVAADVAALDLATAVVHRHGLQFWDAMLWATAKLAGCRLLLSEDLQDGRELEGIRIVNPFDPANQSVVDRALGRAAEMGGRGG